MTTPWLPYLDGIPTFAFLWLLLIGLGARLRLAPATRRGNALLVLGALAVLLVPLLSRPLWNWGFSYFPNPCLPLLGVLLARRCPRFLGLAVFSRADWIAIWGFGACVGSLVYLLPVLGSPVDLYYWGWDADHAAWVLAGAAALCLLLGNRLGLLLLAALVAFALSGHESANCWDYVIDPVYWLAGLIVLARHGLAWLLARRPAPVAAPVRVNSVS